MILHLSRMRINVNLNVYNNRENVSHAQKSGATWWTCGSIYRKVLILVTGGATVHQRWQTTFRLQVMYISMSLIELPGC